MLSPQMGQAALRIITFIVVMSLVLLPFVQPQSAEFVVVIVTLTIGVFAGVALFVFVHWQSK